MWSSVTGKHVEFPALSASNINVFSPFLYPCNKHYHNLPLYKFSPRSSPPHKSPIPKNHGLFFSAPPSNCAHLFPSIVHHDLIKKARIQIDPLNTPHTRPGRLGLVFGCVVRAPILQRRSGALLSQRGDQSWTQLLQCHNNYWASMLALHARITRHYIGRNRYSSRLLWLAGGRWWRRLHHSSACGGSARVLQPPTQLVHEIYVIWTTVLSINNSTGIWFAWLVNFIKFIIS